MLLPCAAQSWLHAMQCTQLALHPTVSHAPTDLFMRTTEHPLLDVHDKINVVLSVVQVNSSILAVGYGQLACAPPQRGCVCVWSLKNPSSPLWAFATPSGVTALDWASNSPNLLALGFNNGTMAVHDARLHQVGSTCLCQVASSKPAMSCYLCEVVFIV